MSTLMVPSPVLVPRATTEMDSHVPMSMSAWLTYADRTLNVSTRLVPTHVPVSTATSMLTTSALILTSAQARMTAVQMLHAPMKRAVICVHVIMASLAQGSNALMLMNVMITSVMLMALAKIRSARLLAPAIMGMLAMDSLVLMSMSASRIHVIAKLVARIVSVHLSARAIKAIMVMVTSALTRMSVNFHRVQLRQHA